MKRKHSVTTTVRLYERPSNIVSGISDSTGKSEAFIASWLVESAWETINRQTETGKFRSKLAGWERVQAATVQAKKLVAEARKTVPKD